MRTVLLSAVLFAGLASCTALGGRDGSSFVLDSATGAEVSLDALADELAASFDVVFLGELHDSGPGHAFQLALTKRLFARRGRIVISMEMFERDQQAVLDRYLAGELDEAGFLEATRTWPNYAAHYRPAIELARREGIPVLAANIPRPLAARVVEEGINAVLGEEYTPRQVHVAAGEYKRIFLDTMGDHVADLGQAATDNVFAAQCLKDDAMAESIADYLLPRSSPRPLVVHWCGAFHSDYGLGTVERLQRRMPRLRIAVLSMYRPAGRSSAVPEEVLTRGRWVVVVGS